ncbi:hypothetical protein BH10BAC3_BH10BAC3_41210 [soil metagenome]
MIFERNKADFVAIASSPTAKNPIPLSGTAKKRHRLTSKLILNSFVGNSSSIVAVSMFNKSSAEAYFNAEKSESGLFIIIGVLAIVLALVLFFSYRTVFFKGIAVPLVLIGILQLVVGSTVYNRIDKQRMDIVYKLDMNPAAIQSTEIPRMQKVMASFKVYRYIEIMLLLAGAGLFLYTRTKPEMAFWSGLAIALALQAGIMLMADGFAEKRGKVYLEGLESVLGSP